ncbi:cyclopropane-fatty-acyl-phospholipid synthase family protein [Jatrophihabitans endophyticus]|uniref:SAM-dependent methyltransferase n=1 Tax=Jatrophihabitans endophyticus TaxID=1206085 RepID=UPI0019E0A6E1|nr:cyclopropane-fatty-acyl-phospholipid synthase family protein [Jatrophihabitans endophyticus]MBE7187589.1 class I SAM-dependent methyltransferase [Jatrophihabitans endophyticus]
MAIADLIDAVTVGQAPMRIEAYDGSVVPGRGDNSASDIVLRLNNERGLRYLLTAPGDLGLARAYVTGDLEMDGAHPGDPYPAMIELARWTFRRPPLAEVPKLLRAVGARNLVPPPPPPQESLPPLRRALEGLRHSRGRDAESISKHYDVSNAFYRHVLGPSMAYTCAVFPKADAGLDEAQQEKFDLVARKLDLQPGMRLLDVGCGWGGMALHAATHYGVEVTAITLSEQQASWAADAVEAAGLSGRARIIHGDYRDAPGTAYDAVSSIGLMEHVGVRNYASYFALLRDKLRPGGRLLNHCITRPDNQASTMPGAFIDRYVFPDGELTGSGRIISAAQDVGLEVRHEENLREHYALTLAGWCANLVEHWDECVAEVGIGTARVWGLYMAGSRLGFETNAVQLHQVLAVKLDDDGNASFPLRPTW